MKFYKKRNLKKHETFSETNEKERNNRKIKKFPKFDFDFKVSDSNTIRSPRYVFPQICSRIQIHALAPVKHI